MAVDVVTEIDIARRRDEVAAFAADPSNATAWYKNIKAVEWETPPPLAVGSKLRFRAQFLGRTLEYTYEVREIDPGHRSDYLRFSCGHRRPQQPCSIAKRPAPARLEQPIFT